MDNKPVFCGQEPAFMAGAFETEEENLSRNAQAIRLSGNPIDDNKSTKSIYFDGELEMMIGFDIVSFIGGTLPKLVYGDKIECITITPDDKKHDAIIYVGRYTSSSPWVTGKHPIRHYCLIRLASDELDYFTAEGGEAEFKGGAA